MIDLNVTVSDWVMIFAVILGPVLAVKIQKRLDEEKEVRGRKIQIFKDLMATRASSLDAKHVMALNLVGLEFNEASNQSVRDSWLVYLDHLNSFPTDDSSLEKLWIDKKNDLLSDLLFEMSRALSFRFDKVHIKKAGYFPRAYAEREEQSVSIRKGLVDLLKGDAAVPIAVVHLPSHKSVEEANQELSVLLRDHLEGKRSLKVLVEKEL